jgi:hypothetical protein
MRLRWSPGDLAEPIGAAGDFLRVQLWERLAILGFAVVAVAALVLAADGTPGWVVVALAALALAGAVRPDTVAALIFLGAYAWAWIALVDRGPSPWALVAAIGLGGLHVATSLASLMPPEGRLPRSLVLRWSRRGVIVAGATAVVWLLAAGMDALDSAADALLSGLALVVLAICAWVLIARSRFQAPPSP